MIGKVMVVKVVSNIIQAIHNRRPSVRRSNAMKVMLKFGAKPLDVMSILGVEPVMVGSRIVCDSPPEKSDTDYLCYCRDKRTLTELINLMNDTQCAMETRRELHYDFTHKFSSYRSKENDNFIVTSSSKFVDDFKLATKLCWRLKLDDRDNRVLVHKAILYRTVDGPDPWETDKSAELPW